MAFASSPKADSLANSGHSGGKEDNSLSGSGDKGWRRAARKLGFHKAYNFPLFVVFAGAILGFSLSRVEYLDINGKFKKGAAPGEWYWYRTGHYHVGIILHLACILPAGILMIWQFVPIIRHKLLIFHRINGYTIVCLVLLSNVGTLMIVRRSFGGLLPTQAAVGTLVVIVTTALGLAIYNIKRLQIDQHRAWMLRAMIWLGTIITTRILMITSAAITSKIGSYYLAVSCGEITYLYGGAKVPVHSVYPVCSMEDSATVMSTAPNTTSLQVATHVNYYSSRPEEVGSSLKIGFAMAVWMSIFLHVAGTEIYLRLTPAESQRLKEESRRCQEMVRYTPAGDAGLTVERFGDA